jgi:hypothetical protein
VNDEGRERKDHREKEERVEARDHREEEGEGIGEKRGREGELF